MSRQFQVYLLPSDVEALLDTLRAKLDISLIRPDASAPVIESIVSPISDNALVLKTCYIVPSEANIKMRFAAQNSRWVIEGASELIEFSGCEFDGGVLVRGRLYFQPDFLAKGAIFRKRAEFLSWADQVFRVAKRSLHRSKTLDAYVGEHAERWRQGGGRFAWMVTPERGPLYERD